MIAYRSTIDDDMSQYGAVVNGQLYTSGNSIFVNNSTFNQPVTIGSKIVDCVYMLYNCQSFNQPVTIGNSVVNCSGMFYRCDNFNQPVIIGNSVMNCANMFMYCNNFSKDIYFKGNTYRELSVMHLFWGKNTSKRVNIWFNSVFNNIFNVTSSPTIVSHNVTWTAMTNGFYNATDNVYCYYNYPG